MGNQKTQKNQEHYYKKFASAYSLPDNCESGDKPDIRIELAGKKIGIEITDFYLRNGSDITSEQQQSQIRERVIAEAQELYEKNRGRGIEINIGFNTITDDSELPQIISNWALSQNFEKDGVIPKNQFSDISEIDFIYVNIGPYEDAKWSDLQVYSISNTEPKALQEIIIDKENKFSGYEMFDENWLLIVIDFINFGMEQEPHNVDYSDIVVSKFDKVILYKTGYDSIIEFSKSCLVGCGMEG